MARHDLGLGEEVWGMTPKILFALVRRWEEEQRRLDLRAGIVAASIHNQWRSRGQKLASPEDFVFSAPKRKKNRKAKDAEQQHLAIEMWNVALGGADLRGIDILPSWAKGN